MVNNYFFFLGAAAGILNVIRAAKKNANKKLEGFMAANPMQQFTVHKIGPEIKFGNIDSLSLMLVYLC